MKLKEFDHELHPLKVGCIELGQIRSLGCRLLSCRVSIGRRLTEETLSELLLFGAIDVKIIVINDAFLGPAHFQVIFIECTFI